MSRRRLPFLVLAALVALASSGCATAVVGYWGVAGEMKVKHEVRLEGVTVARLDDQPGTYSLRIVERIDGDEVVHFTNWVADCTGAHGCEGSHEVAGRRFGELDLPSQVLEVCEPDDPRLRCPNGQTELVAFERNEITIWSGGKVRTRIKRPRKLELPPRGPWPLLLLALPITIPLDLATLPLQFITLMVLIKSL